MKIVPVKQTGKQVAFAEFDDYVKHAQRCAERYREMKRALTDVYPGCTQQALDRAQLALETYEMFGKMSEGSWDAFNNTFNPDDAYDDNGEIKKAQVAKHIALLMGSFPNANPADPEVYTMLMVEEVTAAYPSVVTLEAACRSIRRSSKFIPTISEVLAKIEEQETLWNARWDAISYSDDLAVELRSKIASECERRETDRMENERRKAKALPPAVGDQVRHNGTPSLGCGTLLKIIESEFEETLYRLNFDDCEHLINLKKYRDFLVKLLPGDDGYEPESGTPKDEA